MHRSTEMCFRRKKVVGRVLRDLSKAFDCISHVLLMANMKTYGLSNYVCELIVSYQRVNISNDKYSWMLHLKGIPQRSSISLMNTAVGCPFWKVFYKDQASVIFSSIFYFIETWCLTNYADDNTLDMISCTIKTL